MKTRISALSVLFLCTALSAQASVYQYRITAQGVKAAVVTPPAPAPVIPSRFAAGVAGVTYSNNGQTVAMTGGSQLTAAFANSKSSGKWYWELQSNGVGAFTTFLPGGYYYLDLRYRDRNASGTGILPNSNTSLTTSSTARYGFAADVTSKKMTIYDVTTCAVVTNVTWTGAGAVTPSVGYRTFDSAVTATAYFAPAGPTCIPAGFSWWTGD